MTDQVNLDKQYLAKTLQLAKKALGWTNPNPMVGCLIVKNDRIIGQGYHHQAGLPHAEIEALKAAKTSVVGATLYVNLEPCSHWGKTPPCINQIIQAGIKKVVCSSLDPNPKVHGQGIAMLKKNGIDTSIGILEKEARLLNEAFVAFHEKKRPFIALKFAASIDGKIATSTGESKWITNETARNFTQNNLWPSYQAVLLGINTVMKDNEPLKIMEKKYKNPLRIVLDSHLRIPFLSNFLWDNHVIIATTKNSNREKRNKLIERGFEVITVDVDENTISLRKLLKKLYEKEIVSLLVEGGSKILGSFVDEQLFDKVYAFHAPIIIGGEKSISAIGGRGSLTIREAIKLHQVSFKKFGDNVLTIGYRQ